MLSKIDFCDFFEINRSLFGEGMIPEDQRLLLDIIWQATEAVYREHAQQAQREEHEEKVVAAVA